jgi:pimeloyl-ACP methyl ester carboxylesterase
MMRTVWPASYEIDSTSEPKPSSMSSKFSGHRMTILLFLSLVFIFGIAMPWLGLKSGSEPVVALPLDNSVETVIFESDELQLEGWWMPAENPRATLLFVHGAGSSRVSPFFNTLGFYDSLQKAGVSVFTFDQRNHGNSEYTDGYLRMGATEYSDVLAARDWLRGRTDNDTPVIICGLSMGGATSIYALAAGMQADGLLLFDPMLNTRDSLERGGWVGYGLPSVLFRPMAYLAPLFWGLPYGESDALEVAKALDLPIAIVQNKTDPITRSIWSEELANAADSATIAFVPDIDASDPCMADKGRWGTHASSFHCHPDWTIEQVENLIARLR